FFKLGSTFEKIGDLKKAIYYLVQAESADKENIEIKLHMAQAYLAIRKPIMAERPLKEILKLNPENMLATELLRQC
ncbi:MAG: tetratricopeptide repeat protein, partial [Deltaproteobacteria bacterium]|nr:tetratricopeptide repeat protein [Deltaproteobacteria bacterium]